MFVSDMVAAMRKHRYRSSTEALLQRDLADHFAALGISGTREYRLSATDRIDFMLEGGVGVEAKVAGARPREVLRQLGRYAEAEEITALVLVTAKAMGCPDSINGKPVYYVSVGRGAFAV